MSYFRKKFELCPRLKSGVGRGYSQNQILKISSVIFLLLALALAFNAFRLIFFSKNNPEITNNSFTPQVLGASDTKSGADTQAQFIEYKIQKGDTLFNISQQFNITWTTLATLNNLSSPFTLKPGQTLKIPR